MRDLSIAYVPPPVRIGEYDFRCRLTAKEAHALYCALEYNEQEGLREIARKLRSMVEVF